MSIQSLIFRAVEHEAGLNLRPGILSPYNSCCDYQRYVSSLALSSSSPPTTRVSADGSLITFRELPLNIHDWRHGLRRHMDKLREDVGNLCYGLQSEISMPDHVPDDWANEQRGYSWVNNYPFIPDRLMLFKAMIDDPKTGLQNTSTVEGELEMNVGAMWRMLERCTAINRSLCVALHITPGQSPRAAEYVELKISNASRGRGIFMHGNQLVFATRRLKTETATKRDAFNPVVLDKESSNIVIAYLLLIRPVEELLGYMLRGDEAKILYSEFMWVQNCSRVSASNFYDHFREFMLNISGVAIGVHDWRQFMVQIARVYLGSEFEIDEEEFDALSGQRGHTVGMSHLKYALEFGIMSNMSSDTFLRFERMSQNWHGVTGLDTTSPPLLPLRQRRLLRDSLPSSLPIQPNLTANPIPSFDLTKLAESLTATIVSEIGKLRAELPAIVMKAVADGQIHSERSSARYHDPTSINTDSRNTHHPTSTMHGLSTAIPSSFIRVNSPPPIPYMDPAPSVPISSSMGHELSLERSKDLLELLARHFPNEANPQFRSHYQLQAIDVLLRRDENFILVLPTGGGKSLLFTLPPLIEKGYTSYVVVPNASLLRDHLQKAENLGIRCHKWTATPPGSTVGPDVALVFLAVESAVSREFAV